MRTLLRTAAAALLLTASGCAGEAEFTPDPAAEAAVEGTERFAILTRGEEVKLGLTDEVVYFRLSDATLQEIDRGMQRGVEDKSGLGAAIAASVTRGVSSAVRYRMQYRVEDIRDVRYQDGRLAFDFESSAGGELDLDVNGEPVQTQFAPEDAARFVEEFRRLKQEVSSR